MYSNSPGFFAYEPSADKHTVIDAGINHIHCLTSSNDGKGVWGVVDKHLYSIEHGRQDDVFGRRVSFRHQ